MRESTSSCRSSVEREGEKAHLEDMERLELDILAPILEQVHHDFEVLLVGNVPSHDFKVCPIEQDLAEEFERLPFRDIVGRLDQERVLREELRSGRGWW